MPPQPVSSTSTPQPRLTTAALSPRRARRPMTDIHDHMNVCAIELENSLCTQRCTSSDTSKMTLKSLATQIRMRSRCLKMAKIAIKQCISTHVMVASPARQSDSAEANPRAVRSAHRGAAASLVGATRRGKQLFLMCTSRNPPIVSTHVQTAHAITPRPIDGQGDKAVMNGYGDSPIHHWRRDGLLRQYGVLNCR